MGSILQFFDLNHAHLSRKVSAHKKHVEGLEAPRNSLEFSVEMPQSSNVIHDDIPYSCQVRQQSSKASIYRNGIITKKSIDDGMSKQTNVQRNTPGVVARLMGMDNLPSEVTPKILFKELKDGLPRSTPNASSSHLAPTTTSIKKTGHNILAYGVKKDSRQFTNTFNPTRPQPREHPQEELLQKFKKEFEEWQASRVWEQSSSFEAENYIRQTNVDRFLAQENLNKEKVARNCDPKTKPVHYVSTDNREAASEQVFVQDNDHASKQLSITMFDKKHDRSSSPSRLRHEGHTSKQLDITKSAKKQDRPCSSTRIVILKPGLEQDDALGENWSRSPEILEKEGSMKAFLEEVKERLKSEMLGKAVNKTKAREIITEASFGERSPDTKQFARHIAKKIKESVTRDLRSTFIHPESTTRSYKREVQLEHPESRKFVNRDIRRVLSDRLKNVLRNEAFVEVPQVINQRTRTKKERIRSRSVHDFSKLDENMSYLEDMKSLNESKATASIRMLDAEPVSPRNLIRSLSAPVSGTAFGRLLLEDQHVFTGAHICRKQEESDLPSQETKKKKKDGFNLKGTVSNFKHNFIRKGKLFGKKTQLVDECKEPIESEDHFSSLRPIVTGPSVVEKCGVVQDNSTEVPPSPASLTDSSQDDFFRPGHASPVSPLPVRFIEDQSSSKLSTDISSMLPEPKEYSEQADHVGGEVAADDGKPSEDETVELHDNAEGYVREILIAAGLYDAEAFGESFPRWDASTKPIPNWVFDKVEETYNMSMKSDDGESLFCYGDVDLSRRMLFDLVNEALPCVLKVDNPVLCISTMRHGKILLDGICSHIQGILNCVTNESNSIDNKVAEEVRIAPWFNVIYVDVDPIGRKMETVILADLISELIREMFHVESPKTR